MGSPNIGIVYDYIIVLCKRLNRILYHIPGAFFALLLQKGSLQAYKLGVRLRERYRSLLPKNGHYSTNEMFVMSSATERCLMTAQSFLAGFLPPNDDDDDQRYALPIKWQPVAINSVPRESDRV